LAADAVLFIRSDAKVAIPHFLGRKEDINTTFFGGPFAIGNIPFQVDTKYAFLFYG